MLTRCLVLAVLLTAAPAAAQSEPPAHSTRQAQLGLMVVQVAGYFGAHRGFSDTKFDSNGVVWNVLGIHAGYAFRPVRYLEIGPRVDLMYIWFRDAAYLPEALYDLRPSASIAGVLPLRWVELVLGVDVGIVASLMETKSGHFLAAGGTVGAFLSVRGRPGQPWGWFADISAGYADVDGDSYRAEMIWLARFSAGATYSW